MAFVLDVAREWALLSLGGLALVMIFKATGVFNLGQGTIMLLDAYLVYALHERIGNAWLALLATLLLQVPIGLVLYLMLRSMMMRQALWPAAIATLGVAVVVESVVSYSWHLSTHDVPAPLSESVVELGSGAGISWIDLAAVGLVVLIMIAVVAGQRMTMAGLLLRATGENPLLASQGGVNIRRVFACAWCCGLACAALAGALYAYRNGTSPGVVAIGLGALAPAVLGGLDSLGGVFLGALVAAVVEQVALREFGGDVAEVALFGVVLAVLVIRPHGFFGTVAIARS